MLSLKKIPENDYHNEDYHRFEYVLLIDGEVADGANVHGIYWDDREEKFEVYSENTKIAKRLLNYKWEDFPNLNELVLVIDVDKSGIEKKLYIEKQNDSSFAVNLYFNPILQKWKKQYSYQEFERAINETFEQILPQNIEFGTWNNEDELSIECKTNLFFENRVLIENLKNFLEVCETLYLTTKERLEESNQHLNLIASFNFPEEIKIYCEQYLLYFAKFLQDLGINATSNLNEEAGKVLFSVTPTDDVEALDKIREALAVYLKLPESPILDIEDNGNFAIMRLKQQVENLQHSQRMTSMELRLAQKVIADQDKLLKQSYLQNEQFAKVLEKVTSKSIMMDSAENKEEFVKICEGLEIGESKFVKEQLGTKFNPAKFIKSIVENTLGKGDEIIELNLNKDE